MLANPAASGKNPIADWNAINSKRAYVSKNDSHASQIYVG